MLSHESQTGTSDFFLLHRMVLRLLKRNLSKINNNKNNHTDAESLAKPLHNTWRQLKCLHNEILLVLGVSCLYYQDTVPICHYTRLCVELTACYLSLKPQSEHPTYKIPVL